MDRLPSLDVVDGAECSKAPSGGAPAARAPVLQAPKSAKSKLWKHFGFSVNAKGNIADKKTIRKKGHYATRFNRT